MDTAELFRLFLKSLSSSESEMSSSDKGFLLGELQGVLLKIFFDDSSELLSDDSSADKLIALEAMLDDETTFRYFDGELAALLSEEDGDVAKDAPREGELDLNDDPSEAGLFVWSVVCLVSSHELLMFSLSTICCDARFFLAISFSVWPSLSSEDEDEEDERFEA